MLWPTLCCVLALAGARAAALHITDEQFAEFPKLYHLDDYESCLAGRAGLYCLGSFHAEPASATHHLYDLMKEYSRNPLHYNYTQLHRGYCVSARCPSTAAERNSSLRFQQCAQQWAHSRDLQLHLTKLHYCRTPAEARAAPPLDAPRLAFLVVVTTLVLLSAAGTAYDLLSGDSEKKSAAVLAWSVRANWRRLTQPPAATDPRLDGLQAMQGVRVLALATVIWSHAGFVQHVLFVHSPRAFEDMMQHPLMMLVKNGTVVVQVFVIMTSFLLAYNLLLYSCDHELSLALLPKCIFNRYIRLTPVHLLVVGYAATWWPQTHHGPMWSLAVDAESHVCRTKFWTHALYVNNLVYANDHCFVQTWFLAVDLQLYSLAAVLTLALARLGRRALPVLGALFIAACLLNGGLAYVYSWKTMMYIMIPENLRTVFHSEPSFSQFYTSPWGSLPACLLGLFIAHLHFHLQQRDFKASEYKWFVWMSRLCFPLALCWIFAGYYIQEWTSREAAAAHVALERPVFGLLSAVFLFAIFNKLESYARSFLSWQGWRVMGRLSLSVLMLHWCINMILAASRPLPLGGTWLDVLTDWMATGFSTYILAVPVSLLVEMPIQRFAAALLS